MEFSDTRSGRPLGRNRADEIERVPQVEARARVISARAELTPLKQRPPGEAVLPLTVRAVLEAGLNRDGLPLRDVHVLERAAISMMGTVGVLGLLGSDQALPAPLLQWTPARPMPPSNGIARITCCRISLSPH